MLDGAGVEQPTCDIIHGDYVGETIAEQEYATKDYSLHSAHLHHHPDISHDSIISVESCENLVPDDVATFDHSQNTWDVSFSSRCGEDESSTLYLPNLSSHLFENLEGEIYHFSSSLLCDSSNHEDVSVCDL